MPFNSEKVLALPLTDSQKEVYHGGLSPTRALGLEEISQPLYDFLQEAILDQPLPMRAAQVFRLEYRLQSNYAMQIQAYYAVLLQARCAK